MAGIVLKRLGHTVHILERSPPSKSLRSQGAGIVAQPQTLAFFRKHDRTHTPLNVTSRLRHYLDRNGNEIDAEESQQSMTSWDLLSCTIASQWRGRRIVPDGVQSDERY